LGNTLAPNGSRIPPALDRTGGFSRFLAEPFEPQILGQKDNGFVVSCPARTPGILHFDKIASEFTDSKNKMHKTAASAYASTCGIDEKFVTVH